MSSAAAGQCAVVPVLPAPRAHIVHGPGAACCHSPRPVSLHALVRRRPLPLQRSPRHTRMSQGKQAQSVQKPHRCCWLQLLPPPLQAGPEPSPPEKKGQRQHETNTPTRTAPLASSCHHTETARQRAGDVAGGAAPLGRLVVAPQVHREHPRLRVDGAYFRSAAATSSVNAMSDSPCGGRGWGVCAYGGEGVSQRASSQPRVPAFPERSSPCRRVRRGHRPHPARPPSRRHGDAPCRGCTRTAQTS